MDRGRGGRRVLAVLTGLLVLVGAATWFALRARPVGTVGSDVASSADPAPDARRAAESPGTADGPQERRVPRRNRVTVLHGAQDEAVAEAKAGLDEIARARRALQGAAPAGAGRAPAPEPPSEDRLVVTHHPDGSEFRRGWLRGGERDGLWSEWFESGARVETHYRNGVRHGREAAWHPDGKPRFLGEYEDGEMSGTWTAWHANGHVLSTRQYAAGRLDGRLRTFHESGALAEESFFRDGREVGVNRGWHPTGHLAWEIVYVDGEREGDATWYDDQGRLLAQGTYVAGALHGAYVEYAPDGTVKGTEQWDHGQRVARGE